MSSTSRGKRNYKILCAACFIVYPRYIPDPEFDPEKVKAASSACEGLVKWVRAMDTYDKVAKIVMPKKKKLAEAEAALAIQMEKLNAKRAELQAVRSYRCHHMSSLLITI